MRSIPSTVFALLMLVVSPLCLFAAEIAETEAHLPALQFKSDSPVTPYVGAGIVPEDLEKKEDYLSLYPVGGSDTGANYGFAAGFVYDLGKALRFDLGYRYSPARLPGFLDIPFLPDPAEGEDHHLNFNLNLKF